jgi:hypothetical protein
MKSQLRKDKLPIARKIYEDILSAKGIPTPHRRVWEKPAEYSRHLIQDMSTPSYLQSSRELLQALRRWWWFVVSSRDLVRHQSFEAGKVAVALAKVKPDQGPNSIGTTKPYHHQSTAHHGNAFDISRAESCCSPC